MTVNDLLTIYLFIRKLTIIVTFLRNNLPHLSHRFRGGKGDQWKSDTDGYIYYDNLYVRQISI